MTDNRMKNEIYVKTIIKKLLPSFSPSGKEDKMCSCQNKKAG